MHTLDTKKQLHELEVIQDNRVGIFLLEGNIVLECNLFGARILGYANAKEPVGKSLDVFFETGNQKKQDGAWIDRIVSIKGTQRYVSLTKHKNIVTMSVVSTDKLLNYISLINDIIARNFEGAIYFDAKMNFIWSNYMFAQLTGYSQEDMLLAGIEKAIWLKDVLQRCKEKMLWEGNVQISTKQGYPSLVELKCRKMNLHDLSIEIMAVTIKELCEEFNQDQINQLAFFDDLTGVYNRCFLLNSLEREIKRASRNGEKLAIIYLDLDDFKDINDSRGHCEGDRMLKVFAEALKTSVRDTDIVARLGGDEFICLLNQVTDEIDIHKVISRLANSLKNAASADEGGYGLPFSAGVSIYPEDGINGDELIRHGDIAMYHAKRESGVSFKRYHPDMKLEIEEQLELASQFKQAILGGELTLRHNPIVILTNSQLICSEVDIVWEHPSYGELYEEKIIPIARTNHQLYELYEWALHKVCNLLNDWIKRYEKKISILISVPLKLLGEKDFITLLHNSMKDNHIDTNALKIQINENISLSRFWSMLEHFRYLNELGIQIAVKDVSISAAYLNQIEDLSVHILKVDYSYCEIDTIQSGLLFSKLISSLKIETYIEGISDNRQLDELLKLGYYFGQGKLFGESLTKELIAERYLEKNDNFY